MTESFTLEECALLRRALVAAERTGDAAVRASAARALEHLRQNERRLDDRDAGIAIAAFGVFLAEESSENTEQPMDHDDRRIRMGAAQKLTRLRAAAMRDATAR